MSLGPTTPLNRSGLKFSKPQLQRVMGGRLFSSFSDHSEQQQPVRPGYLCSLVSRTRAFRRVLVSFEYLPWLQAGQIRSVPPYAGDPLSLTDAFRCCRYTLAAGASLCHAENEGQVRSAARRRANAEVLRSGFGAGMPHERRSWAGKHRWISPAAVCTGKRTANILTSR